MGDKLVVQIEFHLAQSQKLMPMKLILNMYTSSVLLTSYPKSRLDSIDILSYATLSMTDAVLELEQTQLLADWSTFFISPTKRWNKNESG